MHSERRWLKLINTLHIVFQKKYEYNEYIDKNQCDKGVEAQARFEREAIHVKPYAL